MDFNVIPPQQKPSNKKLVIFLILLIIATLGVSVYYLFFKSQKPENTPPALTSQSTFQGYIGEQNTYFEFDKKYVKNYENPMWADKLKENEKTKNKRVLEAEPGFNYLYSEKDIKVDELIGNIIPEEGNGISISVYNPEKDTCIQGEAGFNVITEPSKLTILSYCGIIIKSRFAAEIWGMKNQTDAPNKEDIKNFIENNRHINGWILIAIPDDEKLIQFFKESSKNMIRAISPMKEKDSFDGDDFDYSEMGDMTKLAINEGFYLAWVNFAPYTKCPYGEFSVGEVCLTCPNEQYDDRECLLEEPKMGEVAIWHLDNDSDDSIEDSISFNDGKIKGASLIDEGLDGSALSFNGIDTYVQIENSPDFIFENEMTISAWAKPYDYNQGQIFEMGNNGIYKDEYKGWRVVFRINDKNFSLDWEQVAAPKLNEWYNIVGTYDGQEIKLYVNGEEVNSLTKEGTLSAFEEPVFIGSANNEKFFNGAIDEVSIYNKALTKDEVKALYDVYFITNINL